MKYVVAFIFLISFNAKAEDSKLAGTFEVRTAPLALYAAWITLDATYFLNKNWAIGPSYISYANNSEYGNMLAPTYYGNAYGAHAIWALDDLFSNSWYVSSHAYFESYRSRSHGLLGNEENRKGYRVNAVVGFRQLNGNFLTMVGLGYEVTNHEVKEIYSASNPVYSEFNRNYSYPHAEFKAGWLF